MEYWGDGAVEQGSATVPYFSLIRQSLRLARPDWRDAITNHVTIVGNVPESAAQTRREATNLDGEVFRSPSFPPDQEVSVFPTFPASAFPAFAVGVLAFSAMPAFPAVSALPAFSAMPPFPAFLSAFFDAIRRSRRSR